MARVNLVVREVMDSRWYTFAGICKERFGECEFQERLIAECGGNEDIAWAAFFHLRSDALSWLERRIPILSNKTPAELICKGKSDEVRHALWSFPC